MTLYQSWSANTAPILPRSLPSVTERRAELSDIELSDVKISELQVKLAEYERKALELASRLTESRKKAAENA